ncbi:MAG TPA: hypothetical protein VLL52_22425 [Anaerolineae bacterium]|nr:hypothetical protein [Anaerolineae bacterium]
MNTNSTTINWQQQISYPWQLPHTVAVPAYFRQQRVFSQWTQKWSQQPPYQHHTTTQTIDPALLSMYTTSHVAEEWQAVITQLMAWMFIQNDHIQTLHELTDLEELLGEYAYALRAGVTSYPEPTVQAIANLGQQLLDLAAPHQLRRFYEAMDDYWFKGILPEFYVRQHELDLTPSRYLKLRGYATGLQPLLELNHLAQDLDLPWEVRNSLYLQYIDQITAKIVSLVNDLFVGQRGNGRYHYLNILMDNHHIDATHALNRAMAVHNDLLLKLIDIHQSVINRYPEHFDALTQRFAINQTWISGTFQWQESLLN